MWFAAYVFVIREDDSPICEMWNSGATIAIRVGE